MGNCRRLNFGIDYGLFDNRLTGSFEYYIKNTKDMLFQKAYPSYSGYPGDAKIWTNVGSMRTKGFEMTINYNVVGEILPLELL